jgi:peptidoglycan/LPS O-acetylase OafA/YrhL
MSSPNTPDRVNEIDFLRFFAALAVVFWHYAVYGFTSEHSLMYYPLLAPVASYGFYGVNLFFMISGFVILMTASNGNLQKFITSRITRLYPAFWFCCSITLLALLLTTETSQYQHLLALYAANMTMLGGFFKVSSLDGSYWSLFVEIQFYAYVAIILYFKQIRNVQYFIAAWLALSMLLVPFEYGKLHRLLITDYSAYFIAGAGFYLIWQQGKSVGKLSIVFGAYVLAISKIALQNGSNFQYAQLATDHIITASLIITTCFLVFSCIALKATGAFGRQQWLKLGALTYPLYLIHQTVGFKIFNALYAHLNIHILFWGTTFLMILAAYWISQYIEKPWARGLKVPLTRFFDYFTQVKRSVNR